MPRCALLAALGGVVVAAADGGLARTIALLAAALRVGARARVVYALFVRSLRREDDRLGEELRSLFVLASVYPAEHRLVAGVGRRRPEARAPDVRRAHGVTSVVLVAELVEAAAHRRQRRPLARPAVVGVHALHLRDVFERGRVAAGDAVDVADELHQAVALFEVLAVERVAVVRHLLRTGLEQRLHLSVRQRVEAQAND